MPTTVLTLRQLNRATLARQMLLERGAVAVGEAVAQLLGLQAQHGSGMRRGAAASPRPTLPAVAADRKGSRDFVGRISPER